MYSPETTTCQPRLARYFTISECLCSLILSWYSIEILSILDKMSSGQLNKISYSAPSQSIFRKFSRLILCAAKICFKDIDSRTGFSVVSIYTVVGLFVLAFLFGKPFECTEMGAMPWISVVVSGITGIAVSHVMYYTAMKRIGATIPSMAMLVTPFTVLALSRVVFGESLNAFQWIFGLVLLVGCGLAIWAQRDLGRV